MSIPKNTCLWLAALIPALTGTLPGAEIHAMGADQPYGEHWNQATWASEAGQWSDGEAPSVGKGYRTAGVRIRTEDGPSSTFGGDYLRVESGGRFSLKQSYGNVATVNLILDGGRLQSADGTTSGTSFQFLSGDVEVASNSIIELDGTLRRRVEFSDGTLSGSGNVTIRGKDIEDILRLDSSLTSTHSGDWIVNGGRLITQRDDHVGDLSRVTLGDAHSYLDIRSDLQIGSLAGSGVVFSDAAGAWTLTTGGDGAGTTFSGTIEDGSGTVALVKEGAGEMILSGENTYSGTTTVGTGTLRLAHSLALQNSTLTTGGVVFDESVATFALGGLSGSGSIVLEDTAAQPIALTVGNNNETTGFGGTLTGAGSLTKVGEGELALTGQNTYSGATTVSGGTLDVRGAGRIEDTSGISVAADATFRYAPDAAHTFDRPIEGDGTVRIQYGAAGNFFVNSSLADFHGQVVFESGSTWIRPGSDFASETAKFHVNGGGRVNFNGDVAWGEFSGSQNAGIGSTGGDPRYITFGHLDTDATYAGTVNDVPLHFVKVGEGTQTFTNSLSRNTATTTITEGAIQVGDGGASGHLGGGEIINNARLIFNRSDQFAVENIISGSGTLTKIGDGTLVLSGNNTYQGTTSVSSGTLRLAHSLALQNSTLTTGRVEFDQSVTGNAFTLGGLSGSGNIALANNADTPAPIALTVGNNNDDTEFRGTLSGTGSLIKVGSGELHMRGANEYQGETVIDGGRLFLGGGASPSARRQLPVGTVVTIAGGAELRINGLGGVDDNNEIIGGLQGNGEVYTGNAGTVARLTIDNTDDYTFDGLITANPRLLIIKDGPGTQTFSGDNTYQGTTTVKGGTLLVNGQHAGAGTYTVENGGTLGGTGTIGGVTTIEPEGALAPGASIGTLNFLDELILDAESILQWEFTEAGNAGEHYDLITGPKLVLPETGQVDLRIRAVGDYTLNAGDSFMLFEGDVYQAGDELALAAGYDVTSLFDFSDDFNWWGDWHVAANVPGYDLPGNLILTAVPEPGTALLLLAALACGLLVRRRR